MKKLLTALLSALAICACGPQKGPVTAVNPITWSDIPDPDFIRVGEDYFMVSTTMYFCPGAPIMHSRDLVHWQIVNYVYDCLEDDDVYNLRDGKNAYGKGQWAATLRYNKGYYYCLFIANDQRKTYIYRTEDIMKGDWERWSVLDRAFHDAGLLFEDDRAYVVWGNGELFITELEEDLSAIKEGGVDQLLISTYKEGQMLRGEGAHVYHIGDWYYVLEIDWPLGGVRTETCWRSKELLGQYESKVVLQGTIGGRGDGVAQGGIIETQFGDWYAVMFQDHGAVGRIPTMQPVQWIDGWPVMGNDGVPVETCEINLPSSGEDYVWASDEFEDSSLQLAWQWSHKPDDACWSLSERPGWLRLKTGQIADNIMNARNSLTQRTAGPVCTSSALLDASALEAGDNAGICSFIGGWCCLGVEVAEDGAKSIVVRERQRTREGETITEVAREPLAQDTVQLRFRYDFRDDTLTLGWSYDGRQWTGPEYKQQMRYTLEMFTGVRTALYCYATKSAGGHADFDWFHQNVTAE